MFVCLSNMFPVRLISEVLSPSPLSLFFCFSLSPFLPLDFHLCFSSPLLSCCLGRAFLVSHSNVATAPQFKLSLSVHAYSHVCVRVLSLASFCPRSHESTVSFSFSFHFCHLHTCTCTQVLPYHSPAQLMLTRKKAAK